jgi:hypothetical protein
MSYEEFQSDSSAVQGWHSGEQPYLIGDDLVDPYWVPAVGRVGTGVTKMRQQCTLTLYRLQRREIHCLTNRQRHERRIL